MIRIALGIEYSGFAYYGWQRQVDQVSVQACVEAAISKISNTETKVICAGRTDTKVHASGQVVHFDTKVEGELYNWVQGANTYLPKDIRVVWAKQVSGEFHARFSATARRYQYYIDNSNKQAGIFHNLLTWVHQPLDVNRMQSAAKAFVGEHDFSAFRSSQCQSHTTQRHLTEFNIERVGDIIRLDICANAFLHHMVRNIVGVLLKISKGEEDVNWAEKVLVSCDRTQAGITAPAEGLYLVRVYYPEKFEIPEPKVLPFVF